MTVREMLLEAAHQECRQEWNQLFWWPQRRVGSYRATNEVNSGDERIMKSQPLSDLGVEKELQNSQCMLLQKVVFIVVKKHSTLL